MTVPDLCALYSFATAGFMAIGLFVGAALGFKRPKKKGAKHA